MIAIAVIACQLVKYGIYQNAAWGQLFHIWNAALQDTMSQIIESLPPYLPLNK